MEELRGGGRAGGVSLGMALRPPDPSKGGEATPDLSKMKERCPAQRRGRGTTLLDCWHRTWERRAERRCATLGAEGRGRRGSAWVHGGMRAARRRHCRNRREEA